jgi:uncharacterized protein (UPF0303 family)
MSDLPVFTVADLEAVAPFERESFDNEDAVDLGLIAVAVIRHHGANLAGRIVLRGDPVFVAKLGTTGPGNDPWLAGKAAVAERFAAPSLLVRRRRGLVELAFRHSSSSFWGRSSVISCQGAFEPT